MPSMYFTANAEQTEHLTNYAKRNNVSIDVVIRTAVNAHMEANKPKLQLYSYTRVDGAIGFIDAYNISDAIYKLEHDKKIPLTRISVAAPASIKHPNAGCYYACPDGECTLGAGEHVVRCKNCPETLA